MSPSPSPAKPISAPESTLDDSKDITSSSPGGSEGERSKDVILYALAAGAVNLRVISDHWFELLRLALSIKTGTVAASVILRKLAAYSRQNGPARTGKVGTDFLYAPMAAGWSCPAIHRVAFPSGRECVAQSGSPADGTWQRHDRNLAQVFGLDENVSVRKQHQFFWRCCGRCRRLFGNR